MVEIEIDGMKLADIINERVRELYLRYHNKQSNGNVTSAESIINTLKYIEVRGEG